MKLLTIAITVSAISFAAPPALAQQQQQPAPAPMVGSTGSPYGSWHTPSNNPGSGTGDMPGTWASANADPSQGMPKGPYGLELAQRIADAQRLIDQASKGKILTDKDSGHIRNLMREDFVAWKKQYDLPPGPYRAERDKWIVEADALSPEQWAKHRLEWLQAERDWILAHGG